MKDLSRRFIKMNRRALKLLDGVDYSKGMAYKITIDDHLADIFEAHINNNPSRHYKNTLAIELLKHFPNYPMRFKGEVP